MPYLILDISDTEITFKYKDYQDGNKQKEMTLSHEEFLRRFEQHILPKGFVKIRHSGFLSHQNKTRRLREICQQLNITAPKPKVQLPVTVLAAMRYGVDISQCSRCKTGKLELVATYINVGSERIKLVNAEEASQSWSTYKNPTCLTMKENVKTQNNIIVLKHQDDWVRGLVCPIRSKCHQNSGLSMSNSIIIHKI